MTVAWEIKSPIKRKSKHWPEGYRRTLLTIWHVDPCKGGSDDSCGWFMRANHGDKEVLASIEKRFEFEWDRVFKSGSGTVYHCGWFCPNGDTNLSVQAIALNMFFTAAIVVFGSYDKATPFMRKHLWEILHFAENSTDSMFDSITRKYENGCREKYDERKRKEWIHNEAVCVYGWILRASRPWYKHPRYHVHHWKVQWMWWQKLHRWLFQRCCICGGRFKKWGESPIGNWEGNRVWHQHCDKQLQAK